MTRQMDHGREFELQDVFVRNSKLGDPFSDEMVNFMVPSTKMTIFARSVCSNVLPFVI